MSNKRPEIKLLILISKQNKKKLVKLKKRGDILSYGSFIRMLIDNYEEDKK